MSDRVGRGECPRVSDKGLVGEPTAMGVETVQVVPGFGLDRLEPGAMVTRMGRISDDLFRSLPGPKSLTQTSLGE